MAPNVDNRVVLAQYDVEAAMREYVSRLDRDDKFIGMVKMCSSEFCTNTNMWHFFFSRYPAK